MNGIELHGSELSIYSRSYSLGDLRKKSDVIKTIKEFLVKSADLIESHPIDLSLEPLGKKVKIKNIGSMLSNEPNSLILYRYYVKNNAVYSICGVPRGNIIVELYQFFNRNVLHSLKQGVAYKEWELLSLGVGVEEKLCWMITSNDGVVVLENFESGFFESYCSSTKESKKIFDLIAEDVIEYLSNNKIVPLVSESVDNKLEINFKDEFELKKAYEWLKEFWETDLTLLVLGTGSISIGGNAKIVSMLSDMMAEDYKCQINK